MGGDGHSPWPKWPPALAAVCQCFESSIRSVEDRLHKQLDRQENTQKELEERVLVHDARVESLETNLDESKEALSTALQDSRDHLCLELQQRAAALEARVNMAEAKVSDCNREVKAARNQGEDHVAALSRVEQQLENAKGPATGGPAAQRRKSPNNSRSDDGLVSHVSEEHLREFGRKLNSKASEAMMEEMRKDMEQSYRVLQENLKVVDARLNRQEEDARVRAHSRSSLRMRACPAETGLDDEDDEDDHHCLACHRQAKTTPASVLLGADGSVYQHAQQSQNEVVLLPNVGRVTVQPRPTRPSIPQVHGPEQIVNSLYEAADTHAAVTAKRSASTRHKKVDCSNYSSSGSSTTYHWQSSRPSTRPSSATSYRGRRIGAASVERTFQDDKGDCE